MTLTQQQRAQLLEMHRAGWSRDEMTRLLGIPADLIEHAIGLALALERKPKPPASKFTKRRNWRR